MLESCSEKSEDDVDDIEQSIRRPCLVINNLPPQRDISDEEVFLDMCQHKFGRKFRVTPEMISKIHRVPKPANRTDRTKPEAMVVKFSKDKYRDMIFKNKREMKGSGITITELLTNKRSALVKSCIDKIPGGPNRAIWTDNGKIFAKYTKDERNWHSQVIKKEDDISKFIQDINHLLPDSNIADANRNAPRNVASDLGVNPLLSITTPPISGE